MAPQGTHYAPDGDGTLIVARDRTPLPDEREVRMATRFFVPLRSRTVFETEDTGAGRLRLFRNPVRFARTPANHRRNPVPSGCS